MVFAIVLLTAFVGAGIWYWQGLKKQTTHKKGRHSASNSNAAAAGSLKKSPGKNAPAATASGTDNHSLKYRAVSIHCKEGACEAAKALADKRFLTSAAPSIPLPNCDKTRCQCSYTHHNDRRNDDERRSVHGLQTELYPQTTGSERRLRRGRRKTDGI
ncbi:MAG TPA: hypothetical protein VLC91_09900 [Spongiibacteraceae bacterium]|nr:hypothetical protein [Spongiibacteraceae bacterium]